MTPSAQTKEVEANPELIILDPGSGVNTRLMLARMTDLGIRFCFEHGYRLPQGLPADRAGIRCVISTPDQVPPHIPQGIRWLEVPRPAWESESFVERIPALGGLTLDHPAMRRRLESVSDEEILDASRERMSEYRYQTWNDVLRYNLECLWDEHLSMGDGNARDRALALAREALAQRPASAANCDVIACLYPLLPMADALPEVGVVDYARRLIDLYLASTPRFRGVLNNFAASHEEGVLRSEIGFQACPAFARLAKVTGDSCYAEAAVEQQLLLERELADEKTGLWHLGRHESGRTPSLWARGCVFAFRGLLDTLAELPETNPARGELAKLGRRMADGLINLQNADGLWHQVLDEPATRPECSASSWAVGGLALALKIGVVGDAARPAIDRGWRALKRKSWAGLPVSICAAVTASLDPDYYRFRPFAPAVQGHIIAYSASRVMQLAS